MSNIICIDGFSASGKSSIALSIGKALGYHVLNSGIIYRFAASLVIKEAPDQHNSTSFIIKFITHVLPIIKSFVNSCTFSQTKMNSFLTGDEISTMAATIGSIPEVRGLLVPLQREFPKVPGLVAEGRDMGTTIFPETKVKFFLFAALGVRWIRRCKQFGVIHNEVEAISVVESLIRRDCYDLVLFKKTKLFSFEDYYKVDTSYGDAKHQSQLILNIINHNDRLS